MFRYGTVEDVCKKRIGGGNGMTKTRMKIGCVAFVLILGTAILKNWLPGIDTAIIGLAVLNVLGYILGDTIRKSDK
jgi:tetrahydromethanopterin S-methyltransferase subunit C